MSDSSKSRTTPWYKQFYPWFLIAIPLSSVIVGAIVISLATDGTNSLVVDDYYKEGKTINVRLDKIEKARQLNIQTVVDVDNQRLVLSFLTGLPESGEALKMEFFHATLPERDTNIILTRDAFGNYRAPIHFDINGKWRLRLMPMNEEWKIQRTLHLPQATPFKLSPDT